LVRRDKQVEDLLDRFVCVRIVQANAMDLSLFQFDYDLTFAAFFMNADKTIYGRYGSRSEQKLADKDISMEGLRKALAGALELHRNYPGNKTSLAGKQSVPVKFKSPEEYPSLAGKYKPTLDYAGKVAPSCMHCHQVRDAERKVFRSAAQPIPEEVLNPWPMPDAIGLSLDPKEKAKVTNVKRGSAAMKAGFKSGDEIMRLEAQPILSIADVQWVMQQAKSPAKLNATVLRRNRQLNLTLDLGEGWRRESDISWRTTTWDLRRMAVGGLVLKESSDPERRTANLSASDLALRVEYVGQYGEHAAGKRAGFQKDDVIVDVSGRNERMTESDLFRFLLQTKMPGARVPMTVLRNGNRINLEMPMQ